MARSDALLRLHKSLIARRAELRKRLGIELEDLHRKQSSATGDSADAAFDSSGEEIASQLAELEAKELAQVERALKRLKQGTYGRCEICSTRIPVARLNALPYSTLCIKCQRELEVDGGWTAGRGDSDWARITDHDHSMEDREVNLADLEIDLSK
jgi:DnaK suppressor protein